MSIRLIAAALALGIGSASATDAPDCSTFTWDMTRELALFSGAATALPSGADVTSAPTLEVGTLYEISLHPLSDVTFARPLGKTLPAETSAGGVMKLQLNTAGQYRISSDSPLWIDVIAAGETVTATGFQGRQPCALIHKSVEWTLPGGVELIVQVAGAALERAKFAVTATPSAAAIAR